MGTPLNLTILEIEDGQCRFGVTDDSPFLFCGLPTKDGSVYCTEHHELCHVSVSRKQREVA